MHCFTNIFSDTATGVAAHQPHKIVPAELQLAWRETGKKQYELKDHLGNVRVVLSDRKEPIDSTLNYFTASVLSASNYYPFGMQLPEGTYVARDSSTRYGFNEKEYNLWTSSLKIQDYGFRYYNPATARFLSVDPLTVAFPNRTPYSFTDYTTKKPPAPITGRVEKLACSSLIPQTKRRIGGSPNRCDLYVWLSAWRWPARALRLPGLRGALLRWF